MRAVAFFAVVLALAIYAGQPDALFLLALGLVVFAVVVLGLRGPWFGGSGPILRPAVDLALASAAGAALGAPLLLPGLQLTSGAIRTTISGSPALSLHDLVSFILQGFDGLPVAGSHWFGYLSGNTNYLQSANYVGVIAVVLVVLAVACRHRNPEVVAFGVVAAVMATVVFVTPVAALLDALPYGVRWHRGELVLAFALAVLAGVGADVVVRSYHERSVHRWVRNAVVGLAFILVVLWLVGRGNLTPVDAAIRARSFLWPSVETAVGLAVVGALAFFHRRGRVHARAPGASTRRHRNVAGPGIARRGNRRPGGRGGIAVVVERHLSDTHTGRGCSGTCRRFCRRRCRGPLVHRPPQVAIPQDVNVAFAVHEFDVYDPMTPKALFDSWEHVTGQPAGGGSPISVFCPAVTSATQARRYGVGFVLEPPGAPGPRGAVFDQRVGDESLYHVQGASQATLTPTLGGSVPEPGVPGTPVSVTHPGPASWKIITDSPTRQELRLHLTDVPGWHATLDGHPLPLSRFSGAMLQARIPAGRHTVELTYWPGTFSLGLALAAGSLVGLLVAFIVSWRRRRTSPV